MRRHHRTSSRRRRSATAWSRMLHPRITPCRSAMAGRMSWIKMASLRRRGSDSRRRHMAERDSSSTEPTSSPSSIPTPTASCRSGSESSFPECDGRAAEEVPMSPWSSVFIRVAGLGLAAFAFVGCVGSLDPMAPVEARNGISGRARTGAGDQPTAGLFYPLDIGNHWAVERDITTQIVPNQGEPGAPYVGESTIDVDLVGTGQRFGREYVVQRETRHINGFDLAIDFLYRQDKGGLYNADPEPASAALTFRDPVDLSMVDGLVPRTGASDEQRLAYRHALRQVMEVRERVARIARSGFRASASGRPGPLTGEVGLLQYPLHTNATWHVREDPLVVYTVEANESLVLPAGTFKAWRIAIDWPAIFGPNDQALVWYGRDGLLKLQVHVEANAVDDEGNIYGKAVTHETQDLTALSLVGGKAPTP